MKELDPTGFVVYSNFGTSQKAKDLESNPWASLSFWWREQERQIRYFYLGCFRGGVLDLVRGWQGNIMLMLLHVGLKERWKGYRKRRVRFTTTFGREGVG